MHHSEKKRVFPIKFQNIEFNFFLLGVLFLASAPFISCLIFIYPTYKGLLDLKINIIKDRNTQVFLIVSIILILKSFISIFVVNNQIESWTYTLNWAGIANWIPLFIFSIGLKKYLTDSYKRKLVAKYLADSHLSTTSSPLRSRALFIFMMTFLHYSMSSLEAKSSSRYFLILSYRSAGSTGALISQPSKLLSCKAMS